jgi:hypothetical protein
MPLREHFQKEKRMKTLIRSLLPLVVAGACLVWPGGQARAQIVDPSFNSFTPVILTNDLFSVNSGVYTFGFVNINTPMTATFAGGTTDAITAIKSVWITNPTSVSGTTLSSPAPIFDYTASVPPGSGMNNGAFGGWDGPAPGGTKTAIGYSAQDFGMGNYLSMNLDQNFMGQRLARYGEFTFTNVPAGSLFGAHVRDINGNTFFIDFALPGQPNPNPGPIPVPEPASALLLGLGACGLYLRRRWNGLRSAAALA